MAQEVKSKRIGDFTYRVKQLADPMGMRLLNRLIKVLALPVGAGLKGLPEGKGAEKALSDMTTGAIGDALIALATDPSFEDDLMFIYETLAENGDFTVDKHSWFPLTSDKTHWSGRYVQKYQWIVFSLEANYADFLGGKEALGQIAGMFRAAQQSKSPSTSTGEQSESSQADGTQ